MARNFTLPSYKGNAGKALEVDSAEVNTEWATPGGGGWVPTLSTVLNGIGTDGSSIFLGAPLDRDTVISNSTITNVFPGYGFQIDSGIANGYSASIGVLPNPGNGVYDFVGMRTFAPSPTADTYMEFGASNNALITYGQNPDIVDYSSTVSGSFTPDNDVTNWYQAYFSSGTPTYNYNGYFQRNASGILTQYAETISGQSAENFDSYNSFYKAIQGTSVLDAYYNVGANTLISNYNSTRNHSGAAPTINQRGSTNPAFVKHEIPGLGNYSFDTGEYYRSQRRISIYDADQDGNPLYTYDAGTEVGTYTIKDFQQIVTDPMWDNVIHVDMRVLIENSFGEWGNTEWINILLPDCSDQFTFGREFTFNFIPCTDPQSPAYGKEMRLVGSGGGQTVGGLDIYAIPAQQNLSLTIKGGNNPTIWNVLEGMSSTRFSGRIVTYTEDFLSVQGADQGFVGGTTGLPLLYQFPPYTFSVDGDRAYGKFFVEYRSTSSDKLLSFLLAGDITDPQYFGVIPNADRVYAVYEFEIIRFAPNKMYMTIAASYSDQTQSVHDCSYVKLEITQPNNSYLNFGPVSDTNVADGNNQITIKSGSFINFEPGVIPN